MNTQTKFGKCKHIPISDDVIFDSLFFLKRVQNQHIKLVNSRFYLLSELASRRYPSRVITSLMEVKGITDKLGNYIDNSIRICPITDCEPPYYVEFPEIEPPESILRFTELEISDFISPKLMNFLRLSKRLFEGCWLRFSDFENFVQLHSTPFINSFLNLLSGSHSIELRGVSRTTMDIFAKIGTLQCTDLGVECTADFYLPALLDWLHLSSNRDQNKRMLTIRFSEEVHVGHCIKAISEFARLLQEKFLQSADSCFFNVEIELFSGPHIPEIPDFLIENLHTRETLSMTREHNTYSLLRAPTGTGLPFDDDDHFDYDCVIYVREMACGDC